MSHGAHRVAESKIHDGARIEESALAMRFFADRKRLAGSYDTEGEGNRLKFGQSSIPAFQGGKCLWKWLVFDHSYLPSQNGMVDARAKS
ncbi:MAG: hypothetical protein WB919_16615 [Candidatus Sulfotelmatobacter sp.]